MTKLPKALLLDLDDTIVSFTSTPRDFWREACLLYGPQLEGVDVDTLHHVIAEISAPEYWRDPERAARGRLDLYRARREVVQGAYQHIGLAEDELINAIADHFTREKESAVTPFPGAVEALKEFKARGLKLGLVSNGSSKFQRAKLERYQLTGFFDTILIEGEWGCGKPDASIFLEALRNLEVTTDEAWMVGDNLRADIAGAQAVGITAIFCDCTGKGLPESSTIKPDSIIRHLRDLL
jgi:putative hydrolase of the HAD superfamily